MSDKKTFNEFLKLCNLFTQEVIDKNVLMHRASNFLGGNADLMNWFRNFILYDGKDEVIEQKPAIGGDKVVLSNCRGLGPSYRQLPRREALRECSGRDEMCQAVLNDDWVSHPTWASEDSGFIAHRKNLYEDALHRIEEERHDYDYNIEACARTIQLMEPLVQQISSLPANARADYKIPRGLGGQSETIYERVIKKIYDRSRGAQIIRDMFATPTPVLPILLGRLKQKLEEWKASQREWEKVWREQTQRMFWRSLDHQGLSVKHDKRQFQQKPLQTEIYVKLEEQRRQRIIRWSNVPKYQFLYSFSDEDVLYDTCHLILTYLHYSFNTNGGDSARIETFIKTFIPAFFDLDSELFNEKMSDVYDSSPPNEDDEDEEEDAPAAEESSTVRGRRNNGRKANLLRGVLERGQPGKSGGKGKDRDSRDSTPETFSMDEDTPTSLNTPAEQPDRMELTEYRWADHPSTGNPGGLDPKAKYKREAFNLYGTLNIYCFFRMFQMLYERLRNVKEAEQQVHKDIHKTRSVKPAHELSMVDKRPSDYFSDTRPTANYYKQVLAMCEDVGKNRLDGLVVEETLRRFYLPQGWQLYAFEKIVIQVLRNALTILVSDNKDKSLEVINLFYRDRKEDETSHETEVSYRKQVERLMKEGDIYRISYVSSSILARELFTDSSQSSDAKHQRRCDPSFQKGG